MNRITASLMLLAGLLMIIDGVFLIDVSMSPSSLLPPQVSTLVPASIYMYSGAAEAVVGVLCEAIFFLAVLTKVNRRTIGIIALLLSLASLVGSGGFFLGFAFALVFSISLIRERRS
ncbi:hypothetical protein GCM10007981_12820 [Thermocladium modestius]|uniref:Uncharacterized protein n=1 Tax=Thermocladium modestius TaxID=62609 RepID=A0A830GU50_9CREN|nr:hypothetical protein [Thermocladium modestius]GGP21351.1 hypothetical protein GCM10007981_12820 [Thermocladium modestius]